MRRSAVQSSEFTALLTQLDMGSGENHRDAKNNLFSLSQTIKDLVAEVMLGHDPDSLHDFRVAIRRTRTILSSGKQLPPRPEIHFFRKEFSWLAGRTGTRRDLDVFLLDIDLYFQTGPTEARRQLSPLADLVRHLRLVEHSQLVAVISSRRFSDLLDRWNEFILSSTTSPAAESGPAGLSESTFPPCAAPSSTIRKHVARVADRFYSRVLESSSSTSAKNLHKLRIRCKELRYSLEYFKNDLPSQGFDQQIGQLKQLQDCLGSINDSEIQARLLSGLLTRLENQGACLAGTRKAADSFKAHLIHQKVHCLNEFRKLIIKFLAPDKTPLVQLLLGDTAVTEAAH